MNQRLPFSLQVGADLGNLGMTLLLIFAAIAVLTVGTTALAVRIGRGH